MNRIVPATVYVPLLIISVVAGAVLGDCSWTCGTNAGCNKPNVILAGNCYQTPCDPETTYWQFIYNPGTAVINYRTAGGNQDSSSAPDVACWITQQVLCSSMNDATCTPNAFSGSGKPCYLCPSNLAWCPAYCATYSATGMWYGFKIQNYTCDACS